MLRMLIYIPVNDLSDSAADAETIDELDFGEVLAESSVSASFRLGNTYGSTVDYEFTVTSDSLNSFLSEWVTLPPTGELQADGTTDTLSIRLEPPVTAGNRSYLVSLNAICEHGVSSIDLAFTVVVDRDARRSEWPERATTQTDVFSDQIDRTAEHIELLRYEPVAYDASDDRVIVERGERNLIDGDEITFRSQVDPCDKLNPLNSEWGYQQSTTWIRAHFQPETDEITTSFTKDDTSQVYASTAGLIIPAEFYSDFQRSWALFSPKNDADRPQYKRTVFAFNRNGEIWAILDVIAPPLGDLVAYLECRCIQIHNADMGSPQFFNPWAWTFENNSDKPYAMYPCEVSTAVESIADTSGSNASNPSWNPSVSAPDEPTCPPCECPECPECPEQETAPIPVSATLSGADRTLTVTFDKTLQTATLDADNWSWNSGTALYNADTAESSGNQVVCYKGGMPIIKTATRACKYDPPVHDVIGENSIPAYSFEGFAIS